ncbi:UNVERIFIED_CONTAM: hypothetical protein HHA_286270 [Hammondia hammondi]|eukprot:XP_008884120.1 hypothetical protein HHA_286270 [Hammondia hammondi]
MSEITTRLRIRYRDRLFEAPILDPFHPCLFFALPVPVLFVASFAILLFLDPVFSPRHSVVSPSSFRNRVFLSCPLSPLLSFVSPLSISVHLLFFISFLPLFFACGVGSFRRVCACRRFAITGEDRAEKGEAEAALLAPRPPNCGDSSSFHLRLSVLLWEENASLLRSPSHRSFSSLTPSSSSSPSSSSETQARCWIHWGLKLGSRKSVRRQARTLVRAAVAGIAGCVLPATARALGLPATKCDFFTSIPAAYSPSFCAPENREGEADRRVLFLQQLAACVEQMEEEGEREESEQGGQEGEQKRERGRAGAVGGGGEKRRGRKREVELLAWTQPPKAFWPCGSFATDAVSVDSPLHPLLASGRRTERRETETRDLHAPKAGKHADLPRAPHGSSAFVRVHVGDLRVPKTVYGHPVLGVHFVFRVGTARWFRQKYLEVPQDLFVSADCSATLAAQPHRLFSLPALGQQLQELQQALVRMLSPSPFSSMRLLKREAGILWEGWRAMRPREKDEDRGRREALEVRSRYSPLLALAVRLLEQPTSPLLRQQQKRLEFLVSTSSFLAASEARQTHALRAAFTPAHRRTDAKGTPQKENERVREDTEEEEDEAKEAGALEKLREEHSKEPGGSKLGRRGEPSCEGEREEVTSVEEREGKKRSGDSTRPTLSSSFAAFQFFSDARSFGSSRFTVGSFSSLFTSSSPAASPPPSSSASFVSSATSPEPSSLVRCASVLLRLLQEEDSAEADHAGKQEVNFWAWLYAYAALERLQWTYEETLRQRRRTKRERTRVNQEMQRTSRRRSDGGRQREERKLPHAARKLSPGKAHSSSSPTSLFSSPPHCGPSSSSPSSSPAPFSAEVEDLVFLCTPVIPPSTLAVVESLLLRLANLWRKYVKNRPLIRMLISVFAAPFVAGRVIEVLLGVLRHFRLVQGQAFFGQWAARLEFDPSPLVDIFAPPFSPDQQVFPLQASASYSSVSLSSPSSSALCSSPYGFFSSVCGTRIGGDEGGANEEESARDVGDAERGEQRKQRRRELREEAKMESETLATLRRVTGTSDLSLLRASVRYIESGGEGAAFWSALGFSQEAFESLLARDRDAPEVAENSEDTRSESGRNETRFPVGGRASHLPAVLSSSLSPSISRSSFSLSAVPRDYALPFQARSVLPKSSAFRPRSPNFSSSFSGPPPPSAARFPTTCGAPLDSCGSSGAGDDEPEKRRDQNDFEQEEEQRKEEEGRREGERMAEWEDSTGDTGTEIPRRVWEESRREAKEEDTHASTFQGFLSTSERIAASSALRQCLLSLHLLSRQPRACLTSSFWENRTHLERPGSARPSANGDLEAGGEREQEGEQEREEEEEQEKEQGREQEREEEEATRCGLALSGLAGLPADVVFHFVCFQEARLPMELDGLLREICRHRCIQQCSCFLSSCGAASEAKEWHGKRSENANECVEKLTPDCCGEEQSSEETASPQAVSAFSPFLPLAAVERYCEPSCQRQDPDRLRCGAPPREFHVWCACAVVPPSSEADPRPTSPTSSLVGVSECCVCLFTLVGRARSGVLPALLESRDDAERATLLLLDLALDELHQTLVRRLFGAYRHPREALAPASETGQCERMWTATRETGNTQKAKKSERAEEVEKVADRGAWGVLSGREELQDNTRGQVGEGAWREGISEERKGEDGGADFSARKRRDSDRQCRDAISKRREPSEMLQPVQSTTGTRSSDSVAVTSSGSACPIASSSRSFSVSSSSVSSSMPSSSSCASLGCSETVTLESGRRRAGRRQLRLHALAASNECPVTARVARERALGSRAFWPACVCTLFPLLGSLLPGLVILHPWYEEVEALYHDWQFISQLLEREMSERVRCVSETPQKKENARETGDCVDAGAQGLPPSLLFLVAVTRRLERCVVRLAGLLEENIDGKLAFFIQARNGPSLLACVLVERFVHSSVVNAIAVVLQQLSVSLSFYFPSISSAVSILPTNSSAAAGVLAFLPSLSGAQFIPPSSFPLLLAAPHFDEDATLPAYIRAILLCPAAAPFLERVKGPVLLSQLDRLAAIGRELVGGETEPCSGNAEQETQRKERGEERKANNSSERGRAPQGRTASKRFEEKRDTRSAGGRPWSAGCEDDNRDTSGDCFEGDACDARFCKDAEKPKREPGTRNEAEERQTSAGGDVSSRSPSSTRRDSSLLSLPPAVSESACSSHSLSSRSLSSRSLSSRSLRSRTVREGPRHAQLAADLSWTFQELQIAAAAALAACESGSVSSPLRFCAPRLTSRLVLRARAQQCMVAVVADPAFFLALLVDLIQQRKGQQRREGSFQEAGASERRRRTAFGSFSGRPRKNSLVSGRGLAGFFSRSSPAVGRRREEARKGAHGPRQEGGERRRREEARATQRNAFILGERRRSIAEVLQVLERRRRREGVFAGVPAQSSLNARRHASSFRRQRASKHPHNTCFSSSTFGFPSCFSFPGDERERVSVEFGPSSGPSLGAVLIQRDVEIHSYVHGQALRVRSAPSLPNRTAELLQRLPLLLLLSHPQLVPLLPDFLQDSWPLNADALPHAGDAGHLQALTDAAVAAATASAGGSFLEDEREEGPEARAEDEEEEDLGDRDAFFLTRAAECAPQTPFRSDGEPERETAAEIKETAAEIMETERLDESLEVTCGGTEEFQSETGDACELALQAGQIGSDLLAACDGPETESHSPGRGCGECEEAAAKREEREWRDRSVCLESRQQLRKPLDLAASTSCLQLCLRCEQHPNKRTRASLMAFLNSLFPPCYPSLAPSLSPHFCSSPSAASVARALSRSRCPRLAEWACASRASESPFSPVGPQGSLSRFSSSPSCLSSTLLIEHASWGDPFRLPMRNAPIFPPILEALSSAGHEAEEGAEEEAFVEASTTAAAVAACAALNAPPEATVKAVAEARAWSSRRLLRRIQSRQRRASSSDSHTASWAPTGVSAALATPRGGPGLAFLLGKRPLGSPSEKAREGSQLSSSSEAGDKRGDENSEKELEDRPRRGADTVFDVRSEASRASLARRPEGVEPPPRTDDAVGSFYDELSPIAFEKAGKDFEGSPPSASPVSPTTVAGVFASEKGDASQSGALRPKMSPLLLKGGEDDASRSSASFFSSRFSARSHAATPPRWLLGIESFQPHMVGPKGLSIALLQQSPIRGCLSATAAVPFDAFERTLRHSVNREARRKLQQIISALDLSGDMEKLRRSRNAAKAAATAARAGAAVARAMGQEAPDGALVASAVAGGETVFLHTVLQLERLLKRARHLVRSLHLPPDAFRDLYLFSNSPHGAESEAGRRSAGTARETGTCGRRDAERGGERSEAVAETEAEPGSTCTREGGESERARDGRGKERGEGARGSRRRSMTAPETARGEREPGRRAAETDRCEERDASDGGRKKVLHAEEQRRIKHRQAKLKALLQQNPEHLWNCVKNVWCTLFSPSVVLAVQRAQLRFSQIRIAVILQLVDGICEASFLCRTDIGSLYSRTPREQAAGPSLRLSRMCGEESRSRGQWPEGPASLRASAATRRKPHTPRKAPAASETAEGYDESSTGSGAQETLRHPHGDRSEALGGARDSLARPESSAPTEETEARKPRPGWLKRTPHVGDTFSSLRPLGSLSGSESPRSSGEARPSSCESAPCGYPELRELYGEVTLGLGLAPRELLEGAVASPGEPLLFRARYTADQPFGASLWGAGGDCGDTVRRPEEAPGVTREAPDGVKTAKETVGWGRVRASAHAVGVLRQQSVREEQTEEKGQAKREGSQEGRGREGLLSSGWTREARPSSARGVHASSTSGVRFSLESETPEMPRASWASLDGAESGQEKSNAMLRSRGPSCASLASFAGQASRPSSRCLCCRALSEACGCTQTRTGSRVAPPRVERFPSASTLLRCPSACILVSADLNVEGLETMMAVDGVIACIQHEENVKWHLVEAQGSRASSASASDRFDVPHASSPQSGEPALRLAAPAALPVGGTLPRRWRVEYRQEKWISDQKWRDAHLLQAASVAIEAEKALGFPQVVHGMWVRSAGETCDAGDTLVLLSSRCVPAVQQEAVEETRML